MSNLTRLQAVSSSLDTAINKAENLPDAGSGGGASVETCSLSIKTEGFFLGIIDFYCMCMENGKPVARYDTVSSSTVVNNVLSDSFIWLQGFTSVESVQISYPNNFAEVGEWSDGGYMICLYGCTGTVEVTFIGQG